MDKVSGVTPVVAGVLKNKLGNLSSAVALKITFMGMLSETYRKQLTDGQRDDIFKALPLPRGRTPKGGGAFSTHTDFYFPPFRFVGNDTNDPNSIRSGRVITTNTSTAEVSTLFWNFLQTR